MAASPRTPTPSSPTRFKHGRTEYVFPTPPNEENFVPSLRVKGRMSPAPKKLLDMVRAASTPPEIGYHDRLQPSSRNSSNGLTNATNLEQAWKRQQLSKKKSQYYDDAFAYRESNNTAKDRVTRDSVVIAAIKLNCHLESEQEFLLDLSFQLSEIYQRPESSIMVMVLSEVPMLLGGCSESAYHLTITALPSEVAPTKNKRSTHLIQAFMKDTLQIGSNRGVVRFEAIAEENLATNGMTTLQEIEEMERRSSDDNGVLRTISRQKSRRGKKSIMPIFTERGKTPVQSHRTGTPGRSETPSHLQFSSAETGDSKSTDVSLPERKRVRRRKSFMAFFKK